MSADDRKPHPEGVESVAAASPRAAATAEAVGATMASSGAAGTSAAHAEVQALALRSWHLPHFGEEETGRAIPAPHDGAALDLAYAAVFDESRNDDSGSTEAKLARAAAALPFLAEGPAALLGDASALSAHALRKRAKAQTAALLNASPAVKPDSASQALWTSHPWRRADGSSPLSRSEFFAWLPSEELAIAAERTADSHPVLNVRTLAAWHVEMDCDECMAEQYRGGAEFCPFWKVAQQLVAFEVPLKPDANVAALGIAAPPRAPPTEAALVAAECAKLVKLGVLEVEHGPPEPGSVLSAVLVVQKRTSTLDAETQARIDDPLFVAQKGLERGATIADRAAAIARERSARAPSARDYERAVEEVAGPAVSNRVVLDLTGSGVNGCTIAWPHSLPSVHDATDWLATDDQLVLDVVKGYYAVRVARSSRKLMRFLDPNTGIIYRFLRMVMGGKASGSNFCVLSGMIARRIRWLCLRVGLRAAISVYIDDFLLRAARAHMAAVEAHALAAAAEANVAFSTSKRQCGQVVVYCGARAASNAAGLGPLLSAKPEHVFAFCQSVAVIARAAQHGARVPAWVCAHAAGLGGFVAGFVAALRPRLGAFVYAGDKYSPNAMLDTGRDGIASSATWIVARAAARGFSCHRRLTRDDVTNVARLFSDASGERDQGAGAMFLNEVIHRCWESADFRGGAHAAAVMLKLELDPILGGFRLWGPRWRGKLVAVYVDNSGVAYCINAGRARRGSDAHKMIVELFDLADRYGFEIIAIWLPRRYNAACDTVSKEGSLEDAAAAIRAFFGGRVIHVSAYERFTLV